MSFVIFISSIALFEFCHLSSSPRLTSCLNWWSQSAEMYPSTVDDSMTFESLVVAQDENSCDNVRILAENLTTCDSLHLLYSPTSSCAINVMHSHVWAICTELCTLWINSSLSKTYACTCFNHGWKSSSPFFCSHGYLIFCQPPISMPPGKMIAHLSPVSHSAAFWLDKSSYIFCSIYWQPSTYEWIFDHNVYLLWALRLMLCTFRKPANDSISWTVVLWKDTQAWKNQMEIVVIYWWYQLQFFKLSIRSTKCFDDFLRIFSDGSVQMIGFCIFSILDICFSYDALTDIEVTALNSPWNLSMQHPLETWCHMD